MKKLFLLLMACSLSFAMSARVAYLVPGNSNDKSQIPAQWENHTFEHTAYDWFQETYVNAGVGDFINFTNIPTNADEYAAIWIYIDREWKQQGEPWDEGRMDALFNDDVVDALKVYVQNGGNLFLGKQAARLAYRMGRISYAPNYQCGGYSQDDRFWGIKAKLGSGLAADKQRDRSDHAIYAGLTTATMDGVEGCFPLLNATGDAHSTDNNIHWADFLTPNGEGVLCKQPDNNGDPALISGWETYWNAKALGTWTGIGDYCIIQAVEFMPKDAFTGTILIINIGAYQWNSESTGDAANNMKKLTKNALRYLNRPSRADLKIDNAFKTCGRVDCGSSDAHFNEFMILHPVVEGLNAQPYTTSFEGIDEADRAVVEEWQDGETKRLAFTKAGQVKLQIHLNEARTDHFWPAGDYNYEQTIDFAFSADPVSVISDLSDNGIDKTETNHFMVLHGYMQGLNATYTTSFDGIEEADRATVEIRENLDNYNRLVFTTPGSVKLNINLNAPEYTTMWAKGDHSATKTVTYNPFAWTHEPDHAHIGEQKDAAQATCAVTGTTVKYESSNPTVATIDEGTGKITYLAEGSSDITAYAEIEGIKSVSKPFTINVTTNITTYTRATTAGKYGTICLERTPKAIEGATFFAPVEIIKNGSDQIIGINLEEVPAPVAGVGYYFLANAAEVVVSMDLNETALTTPVSEIAKTHGMLGTFEGGVTVPNDQNEMILSNNQLWYGQNNTVGEHRAWIKLSELQEWIDAQGGAPAPVPGRRRVSMAVEQTNTTTELETVNHNDNVNKMLINGQLYILRADHLYTADGQLVK